MAANKPKTSDDPLSQYDTSGVDYSAFGGEAVDDPYVNMELDKYDTSGVDYSAFLDAVVVPEEEKPGYFSQLTEGGGTVFKESVKKTGSDIKLAAIQSLPEPDSGAFIRPTEDNMFPEQPGILTKLGGLGARAFEHFTDQDIATLKNEASDKILEDIKANQAAMDEVTPDDLTFVQENIRGGLDSLYRNLPPAAAGLIITAFTKNPSAGAIVAQLPPTLAEGFSGRTEAIMDGLGEEVANAYGLRQGGLEALFGWAPDIFQNRMLKDALSGKKATLVNATKIFATEMIGEQATTAYQDINSYLTGLDKEMESANTLGEQIMLRAKRQAATAIQTAVAAGAQQTAVSGVSKLVEKAAPTDEEVIDVIQNAPDLDTAIQIAEEIADQPITPKPRMHVPSEGGPLVEAAVKPERREAVDRRVDEVQRKQVSDMSLEEAQQALLIDDLTGLGNRRAYDEAKDAGEDGVFHISGDEYQVLIGKEEASVDADSLKWINDNMLPASGDQLLQLIGTSLKDNYDGVNLIAGLDKAQKALENTEIKVEKPDGSIVELRGLKFTYGIGEHKDVADANLKKEKEAREVRGERASRGEAPAGVTVTKPRRSDQGQPDTQGQQDNKRVTAPAKPRIRIAPGAAFPDITPASGAYNNREAAVRALKQKRSKKGITEAETSRLAKYTPVEKNGKWVLAERTKAKAKPSAVEGLAKQFKVPTDRIAEVLVEPTSKKDKDVRQLVEKALGKKVVFFESSDLEINGTIIKGQEGTLYINKNSDKPHLAIMGHELLHEMKRDKPEIYEDLKKAVTPMLKDYKPYRKWLNANQKLKKDEVIEEIIADSAGDSFLDSKFWDQMADKSPKLFERVVESIQQGLGKFIKSLNKKELKGTGYLKDYIKVRSEIAKALKRYKETKVEKKPEVKAKPKKVEPKVKPKLSPKEEEGIDLPESTTLQKQIETFQRRFVDKFQSVRKVQKAIGEVEEDVDVDQAITLFPSQTRAALDDFQDDLQTPLVNTVVNSKLDFTEAAEFLHARHAKESNAVLAKRNPEREDNQALSGMTNEEAQTILDKYKDDEQIQKIGELNDQMNADRIQYLLDEGMMTQGEARAWKDNYDHYVPLHREDIQGADLPTRGRGFDERGKLSKLRGGSERQVDHENMLAHIMAQHQSFIVRAHKNSVSKTLYKLAEENPDSKLWSTTDIPMSKSLSAKGVVTYTPNMQDKNLLAFKDAGENKYLYFNPDNEVANKMAIAMGNLNTGTDSGWVNALSTINRYLSQIVTSWNPEFVVDNMVRDVQTAAYNLTDTQLKDYTVRVLKGTPSALRGIRNNLRGDKSLEMSDTFEEFRRAGGMTGWMQSYDSVEQQMGAIKRDVYGWQLGDKNIPGRKQTRKVFDFVNDYNTVVENAVRLSSYQQATMPVSEGGLGLSKGKAAKLSKELTVDFNRKGEWGTAANALYLFFNAGIQGSARILRAATNPKNTKLHKMMAATVGVAALQDVINRIMTSDEDEPESTYDLIRKQEGLRKFIIMDWFNLTDDDVLLKFSLPWGYNVLHILGQEIGGAISHGMGDYPQYTPVESASRLAMGMLEAFNPLQSGTFAQTITPTVLDPAMRIWQNRDWHGGPLYPDFNERAPNYTKFYGTAREVSKDLAKGLHDISLNPETRKAHIDWSPEWIDMGFDFLTGGVGRFAADGGGLVKKIITGEDFEIKEVPMLRRFVGEVGPSARKRSYYEKLYGILDVSSELNRIKKNESREDYNKAREGVGENRLRLIGPAKAAKKSVSNYKKRIKRAKDAGNKEDVKKFEEAMLRRMKIFTVRYQKSLYGEAD